VFAENLDDFFSTSDFAVAASYTPPAGSPLSASVIFDRPDNLVLGDQVISADYAVTMKSSDWPTVKRGETVTVVGVNYKVREVLNLDDGAVKILTLEKI
jgi:hypothetical protein